MINPIHTIIFFFEIPFNQRNFERFGIQQFIDNNFIVEIWDLSQFLHPRNTAETQPHPLPEIKGLIYKKILAKNEVREGLQNIRSNTLVHCFIGFSFRTLFIYRFLSKNKIPYAITVTNTIPVASPAESISGTKTWIKVFSDLFHRKSNVFENLLNRFILTHYRFLQVRPASLCYAGGQKSVEKINYPFDTTTEILWIHTLDYDTFLRLRNSKADSDPNQGVFLDEYVPFHPDFDIIGEEPLVSPEEYYQKICSFFSYLEKHHKTRIVIAAHPRSDYEHLPDFFNGRLVIKGRTAELVQQSGFVITHASTSINYAILFQKPILFLTMNQLKQETSSCRIGYILETICSILGKKPIGLDLPYLVDWDDEMMVPLDAYLRYKNQYIKSDRSPERESWRIIIDHLKGNPES